MEKNMRMKSLLIAGMAMATVSACDAPGEVQVSHTKRDTARQVRAAARLDCPEKEGDLRLVSAASDGRACAYRDKDGSEVELRLTGADGQAELASLENDLRALVPAAAFQAEPPEPPLSPEAPEPPEAPTPDQGSSRESARVRVPGLLDIRTEGDRASVRLPGVTVNADGDNADVRVGGKGREAVNVRAHDGGAEIRTQDEDKGALTSTYLLASETAGPAGWRVAGYQAQGADKGPFVVGVLRSKTDRRKNLMNDVEELVERNVRN
jgi:hypothetical protein